MGAGGEHNAQDLITGISNSLFSDKRGRIRYNTEG